MAIWALLLLAGSIVGKAETELPAFPLQTSGRKRVRLKCMNWYGAHLEQMVANGLDRVSPGFIAQKISEYGFNCVRLPFSLDGVIGNFSVPDPKVSLAGCPELQDLSPLEIFDATVNALTTFGLMVILNNHVSTRMWCCSDSDGEGLWFTKKYSETDWLEALSLMADRYKDNPLVMGFDLRNEIRASGSLQPEWGGNKTTDWARAATEAARRVLDRNENMLIIISGLHYSIFLCQVPSYPLHSKVPFLKGRVVYTAHEYQWFNFHLLAREGIQFYLILMVVAVPLSWLGVCLIHHLRRRGFFQHRCCASACCQQFCSCCSRCNPWVEFSVAAVLATLCALGLKILPHFIQRCDFVGYNVAMFAMVLTPACALTSLILWTRAVFVGITQRSNTRMVAEQVELSLFPGDQRQIVDNQSLEYRQSCDMPQQGQRCKRKSCAFITLLLVMCCTLLGVWNDFGHYEAFAKELDFRWGFLLSAEVPAPVWMGEFGTNSQSLWWKHILRYLAENDVDFAYWAINGEKQNGKRETFGLMNPDFVTVEQPWKLEQLQSAMNGGQKPMIDQ